MQKQSNQYTSRIKAIGHYGLVFGDDDRSLDEGARECDSILYRGPIEKVPAKVWEEVAPLHDNYASYNLMAMATLYKGRGKLSSGTESAERAVMSCLTPTEEGYCYEYVLIWRITGPSTTFVDLDNLLILIRAVGCSEPRPQIWRSETGRYVSDMVSRERIAEIEAEDGGLWTLVDTETALMEAFYGSRYDMDREAKHDWRAHVRPAFRLER